MAAAGVLWDSSCCQGLQCLLTEGACTQTATLCRSCFLTGATSSTSKEDLIKALTSLGLLGEWIPKASMLLFFFFLEVSTSACTAECLLGPEACVESLSSQKPTGCSHLAEGPGQWLGNGFPSFLQSRLGEETPR